MSEDPRVMTGVSLTVSDMATSLAFYRRLGVVIRDESVWPSIESGHHVAVEMPGGLAFELDSAAMTRSYFPDWSPASISSNTFIFSVATRQAVDELHAHMTSAGYTGRVAPFDAFWGARYAVIDDPDGNHVGIMSPMDEKFSSAPPPL